MITLKNFLEQKMNNLNLNDIKIIDLSRIYNKNGDVMHFLKSTDQGFKKFGEVYFSWINYRCIKAWKKHNKMTLNLVVPIGNVMFVFHLPGHSEYREVKIGSLNYKRIIVPPGIWFGFKGLDKSKNLVSNFADIVHDPNESLNVSKDYFSYKW